MKEKLSPELFATMKEAIRYTAFKPNSDKSKVLNKIWVKLDNSENNYVDFDKKDLQQLKASIQNIRQLLISKWEDEKDKKLKQFYYDQARRYDHALGVVTNRLERIAMNKCSSKTTKLPSNKQLNQRAFH